MMSSTPTCEACVTPSHDTYITWIKYGGKISGCGFFSPEGRSHEKWQLEVKRYSCRRTGSVVWEDAYKCNKLYQFCIEGPATPEPTCPSTPCTPIDID